MRNPLTALYLEQQLSIPQIAGKLGVPRSRVRQALVREGVQLRRRADGVRLRRDILGQHAVGKRRVFSQEWKNNIARARARWGARHAKGKTVKPAGYIGLTRGEHKGRLQHVVIMELRLGRRLRPDECVHHIDGDRANNSDDNLALMTRAGHARLHRREQRLTKRMLDVWNR